MDEGDRRELFLAGAEVGERAAAELSDAGGVNRGLGGPAIFRSRRLEKSKIRRAAEKDIF